VNNILRERENTKQREEQKNFCGRGTEEEEQKLKEEEFCKRSETLERNLPKKTLLFSSGRVFQRCFCVSTKAILSSSSSSSRSR
jgi:hypothetical protein